jgi:hypothetical protein
MTVAWIGFALLLIAFFWLTHGGFEEVKIRLSLLVDWFRQLNQ